MLRVDSMRRFTAEDILCHPWVTNKAGVDMRMEVTLKKHFTSTQREGNTTAGVSVIMHTALDKGKLQLCHRGPENSATLPQGEEGSGHTRSEKRRPSALSEDTKSPGVASLQALPPPSPSPDAPPMPPPPPPSCPQWSEEPGDERVFEPEE